jgi:hypothetical protein
MEENPGLGYIKDQKLLENFLKRKKVIYLNSMQFYFLKTRMNIALIILEMGS